MDTASQKHRRELVHEPCSVHCAVELGGGLSVTLRAQVDANNRIIQAVLADGHVLIQGHQMTMDSFGLMEDWGKQYPTPKVDETRLGRPTYNEWHIEKRKTTIVQAIYEAVAAARTTAQKEESEDSSDQTRVVQAA